MLGDTDLPNRPRFPTIACRQLPSDALAFRLSLFVIRVRSIHGDRNVDPSLNPNVSQ